MDKTKTYQIVDLKTLCRMCMSPAADMFSMFDDSIISLSDPISLLSRTSACVGFEILQKKCLPEKICKSCLQVVDHWVVFRSRARSTNDLLLSILAKAEKSLPPPSPEKTCANTSAQLDSGTTTTTTTVAKKQHFVAIAPGTNEITTPNISTSTSLNPLQKAADTAHPNTSPQLDSGTVTTTTTVAKARRYVAIAPKTDATISPNNFNSTSSNILQIAFNTVRLETDDIYEEETAPSLEPEVPAEDEIADQGGEDAGVDNSDDTTNWSEDDNGEISSSEENGLDESEKGTVEANVRGNGKGAWRDRPVKCPVCFKLFLKNSGAKLHLKVVHTIVKIFPCYICGYISVNSLKRKKHIRKVHKSLPKNTCSTCGVRTVTKHAHARHMEKHKEDLRCKICGRQLDSYENLKQHKKMEHHEEKEQEKPPDGVSGLFHCHLCQNVSFSEKNDWKEHYLDVHETQNVYPCGHCDRAYRNQTLLAIHVRSHTGERPYMCEQCPTTFSSRGSLRNHMRKHTTKFQCQECQKTYCSNASLAYHMRSHNKDSPYVCELCGKKFRSKNGVEFHLRIHTGENPFKCDLCDYTCKFKSSLFSHKAVHTTEKPFKCDLCDKSFKLKGWMVTHRKTHIGVKNFVCKICGHAFIANYQLTSHMKTHSGERPHECPECSKTFARRDTLSEHMRTHTQDVKYTCKTCNQDFVFLKPFKKHKCVQSLDELVPFNDLEIMAETSDCFGDGHV